MANITKTYTFSNGTPADATQVNKNFDDIIAGVGDISAAGPALLQTVNGLAKASVKTLRSSVVTASGKTFNGLA